MKMPMKAKILLRNLIASLLVVGVTLVAPNAVHAQAQKNCIPNEVIIPLVKSQKIKSFAKIEKMLRLKKGTKIFGQQLCQVNGKYVYFFKVVDAYGRAKKFALHADDGTPYLSQ